MMKREREDDEEMKREDDEERERGKRLGQTDMKTENVREEELSAH